MAKSTAIFLQATKRWEVRSMGIERCENSRLPIIIVEFYRAISTSSAFMIVCSLASLKLPKKDLLRTSAYKVLAVND